MRMHVQAEVEFDLREDSKTLRRIRLHEKRSAWSNHYEYSVGFRPDEAEDGRQWRISAQE